MLCNSKFHRTHIITPLVLEWGREVSLAFGIIEDSLSLCAAFVLILHFRMREYTLSNRQFMYIPGFCHLYFLFHIPYSVRCNFLFHPFAIAFNIYAHTHTRTHQTFTHLYVCCTHNCSLCFGGGWGRWDFHKPPFLGQPTLKLTFSCVRNQKRILFWLSVCVCVCVDVGDREMGVHMVDTAERYGGYVFHVKPSRYLCTSLWGMYYIASAFRLLTRCRICVCVFV